MGLRKLICIMTLCGISPIAQCILAATPTVAPNAVRNIEIESQGNVEIDIPDNILRQVLGETQHAPTRQTQTTRTTTQQTAPKHGVERIDGYRVQVFADSSNPATLASRAKSVGSAVAAKFPQYRGQVYSFSSAPSWYTRVGNFRTQAEASKALGELKRAFPQYAGSMRVVKCQVVIRN